MEIDELSRLKLVVHKEYDLRNMLDPEIASRIDAMKREHLVEMRRKISRMMGALEKHNF